MATQHPSHVNKFIRVYLLNNMEKILKKNWLLALAAVMISCFAFTACGSDDKDVPDNPDDPTTANYAELLVGEWEFDDDGKTRIVFQSNGTGYEKIIWEGEWDKDATFVWEIKGNKLYLDYYGEDNVTLPIVSLTSKKLMVKIYDEEEDEYSIMSMTKVK